MNLKKDTVQLIIANFTQLLFGLFQIVFFSRLVAVKHDFGQLQQIILISSLMVASAAALPNSINYFFGFYGLTRENGGQLVKRFFFNSVLLAVFITALLLLFHKPIANAFSNDILIDGILPVSGLIFLRLVNIIYQNICLIKGNLRHLIVVHALQVLFLCTVFFFRDETGHLSLTFLIWILIAAELIKTIPLLVSTASHISEGAGMISSLKLQPPEWKYISYLLINGLVMALSSQADRLIVSSFSSPEIYSDYSLGTFANPIIGVVLASVTTTFIPVLSGLYARNDFKGILDIWKKTSQAGVILVLPIVLFTILFGDDVVIFLFSPKYKSAALLFQLFNCKYLLVFVVFSITMNAIGLEKFTILNSIINLVTGSCLVLAGLKFYGAPGAVTGSIIAIYLGYIFPVTLVNRKLRCSFGDYFPVKTFLLTLTLALSAGFVFLLTKKIFSLSSYIIIFIVAPLYYITCFMLLNSYVFQVISLRALKNRFFGH